MGSGGVKTGIGFVDNTANYVGGGQMSRDIRAVTGNNGPSALEQIGNMVTEEEKRARNQAYADSLSNETIDEVTRQELVNLYSAGTSSTTLNGILTAAKEGKGIYAVRKMVENNAAVMRAQPGRNQLVTLGTGRILGV